MKDRQLGRWELLREIGSGGMGSVWLARGRGPGGFDKRVAIKRIHPHLADDSAFVDMFLDEARIAACIDHPNVCSTFDFGETEGAYWLAMELVRGKRLSEVCRALREGAKDWTASERHAFVAHVVAQAAEGLHAAHEARGPDGRPLSVVHRDVAPDNLMLRWDGVVQLTDLGCARAQDRVYRSAEGEARGHTAYVSPEVLRGEAIDRRADVWALGVVMWELLTGERLFAGWAIQDTLFAIAGGPIPKPSELDPTIPAALDAIAKKALARDRDGRYGTALELARDLDAFVAQRLPSMDRAELGQRLADLFPGDDPHELGWVEAEADGRPSDPGRITRTTAIPARVSLSEVSSLPRRLRHPVVLVAMILGLATGLGVTALLTGLEERVEEATVVGDAPEQHLPAPEPPRMVVVRGD